jgi:hypothetical protein
MMHPDIVNDLVRERQRELIAANERHSRQHAGSSRPARRAGRFDTDSEPVHGESAEARHRHRRPIFRRA